MIQLSNRLRTIAEQVKPGSRLADIGSDHALLPAFLAQNAQITFGIAGELNPGPFQAAQKQVAESGLKNLIHVRSGNGLEVIQPGEVDTITIAGMGGALIADILEAGLRAGKLQGIKRLVLQPNVGEDLVRRWLRQQNWRLLQESILEEDGKYYEVLTAEPKPADEKDELYLTNQLIGFGEVTEEDWIRFGPYLLREGSPVFRAKWEDEIQKLEKIAASIALSHSEEAGLKRQVYLNDINRLKELMACLLKDKPLFN